MSGTQTASGGDRIQAQCLCGSVRFSAVVDEPETDACHCRMCQRWAAGPFFTVSCGDSVVFESDDDLEVYRSSDWAERGFCRKCGSSLFWKLQGKSDYQVSMLSIDGEKNFPFKVEIFIDEKPDNYAFANDTKKMTGAEAMAFFTAGQE